jgi:predicted nucleic acid-binding Zn ribbon protein
VRRDEPVRLGDSLHGVMKSLRPDTQGRAQPAASTIGGVFGRWEEAVGAAVAAHVQPVKLDGTTLVVEVDDPAWATQLKFLETTMKTRLAEVAGATIERIDVRVARPR